MEDDGSRRGLDPGDLEQSQATLRAMAAEARAAAALVRLLPGRAGRRCAIVRVHRLCVPDVAYTDLRIAGEIQICNLILVDLMLMNFEFINSSHPDELPPDSSCKAHCRVVRCLAVNSPHRRRNCCRPTTSRMTSVGHCIVKSKQ